MADPSRVALLLAGSLLLAGAVVVARSGPAPATVSGRVLDGQTGAPIPGVAINLCGVEPDSTIFPLVPRGPIIITGCGPHGGGATSNEQGFFTIANVAPGAYEVDGTAPGRVVGNPGAMKLTHQKVWTVLGSGEHADLTLFTWPDPIVEGRVADAAGRPLKGVHVAALAPHARAGHPMFWADWTVTDQDGRYRFALPPNDYVIGVPRVWNERPDSLRPDQPDRGYRPVFFPGVERAAEGELLTLTPGAHLDHIDFQLTTEPLYRVTGATFGESSLALERDLIPLDDIPLWYEPTFAGSAPDGPDRFIIRAVPAGHYQLRGVHTPELPSGADMTPPLSELPPDPTMWIDQPLEVVDRDVDVSAPPRHGARLSGRVVYEGGAAPTAAAMRQLPLSVFSVADYEENLRGLFLDATSFATIQLPPGGYHLGAAWPEGWYLKSISWAGRDVINYPLQVGEADLTSIVMTFAKQWSELSGRVRNAAESHLRAWVIVFSADPLCWQDDGIGPPVWWIETGTDGTYDLLARPGTYLVVASPTNPGPAFTRARLAAYAAVAKTVTVRSGHQIADVSLTDLPPVR